jgi:predicted unusual protein kinase regulating ubiquinone biosynthesis (AarF/ABC1/UbiB family)
VPVYSEERSLEVADQIVSVLGSMKGVAMKLGQMMSVIDPGIVPESACPDFQRKLAALFSQVPACRSAKCAQRSRMTLAHESTRDRDGRSRRSQESRAFLRFFKRFRPGLDMPFSAVPDSMLEFCGE